MQRIETLRKRPDTVRALQAANKAITGMIYLAYPLLLVVLAYSALSGNGIEGATWETLIRAVAVPGVSFVALSFLRSAIDAPRPYEKYGFTPLIPKDTHGHSFPSRHTFSIFIIGMTFLGCFPYPAAGVTVLALGVVLGTIRVLTGVHFPRDVIVGALLGVLCGLIGFYVF